MASTLEERIKNFLLLNTKSKFPIGFSIDYKNSILDISFGYYELLKIFVEHLNESTYLKTNSISIKQTGIIYKEYVIEIQFIKENFTNTTNFLWNNFKLFDRGEGTEDGTIFSYDLDLKNLDATIHVFKNLFDESEFIVDENTFLT